MKLSGTISGLVTKHLAKKALSPIVYNLRGAAAPAPLADAEPVNEFDRMVLILEGSKLHSQPPVTAVLNQQGSGFDRSSTPWQRPGVPSADGSFSFANVPAGRYRLTAWHKIAGYHRPSGDQRLAVRCTKREPRAAVRPVGGGRRLYHPAGISRRHLRISRTLSRSRRRAVPPGRAGWLLPAGARDSTRLSTGQCNWS